MFIKFKEGIAIANTVLNKQIIIFLLGTLTEIKPNARQDQIKFEEFVR